MKIKYDTNAKTIELITDTKTIGGMVDKLCFQIMGDLEYYASTLMRECEKVKYRERYGDEKYFKLLEEGVYRRMKIVGETELQAIQAIRDAQYLIDDTDAV